jgi:hypothetical protein
MQEEGSKDKQDEEGGQGARTQSLEVEEEVTYA